MIINKNNNQQRTSTSLCTHSNRLASWLFFIFLFVDFFFFFVIIIIIIIIIYLQKKFQRFRRERERNKWQSPPGRSSPKIALRYLSRLITKDDCVKKCNVGCSI